MADATADRINALSGGAPLPQAATATIARRLLGPLADRYGDALGLREPTFQDFARDLAVGTMSGDRTKADSLKAQVVKSYNDEFRKEEDQSIQREAAAREQLTGFFNLMSRGKTIPKELRKDFFEESFKKLGYEVTSPLLMKVVTNYEKFGNIYDALNDPMVQQLADDDPLPAQQRLVELGYDGAQVIEFTKQVQEAKRYRAGTQQIIAQTRKIGLAQQGAQEQARATFKRKWAGQTVIDPDSGAARLISPQELDDAAFAYYPDTSSPSGSPQLPAVVPTGRPSGKKGGGNRLLDQILGTGTTGATTEVSPADALPEQPGGIAQSAEAGKAKVRQLTGAVTRVE